MTLSDPILTKLTTIKPGPQTTRLPGLFARKNAALIRAVKGRKCSYGKNRLATAG